MRRFFAVLAAFSLLLTAAGCKQEKRFQKTYIDYFDTVISIIGYEQSEDDFNEVCSDIEASLKKYHELFDIYNSYEGVNNVRTINDNAGKQPVTVDRELLDFIVYAKDMYDLTDGKTNVAMGSVLKLWHDCRTAAADDPDKATIPDYEALKAAAEHCDINDAQIDEQESTVYLSDPDMLLDVGAIAKGYAMQKIYEQLHADAVSGYALNFGGMVRTLGSRGDGSDWSVAIENPISYSSYAPVIDPKGLALSTSGTYQRYYEIDGVRYHHIIDPDTLMPENRFLSVSVLTDDCAMADSLSTALLNMTLEEGRNHLSLLGQSIGVMWVLPDGSREYFNGFDDYLIE